MLLQLLLAEEDVVGHGVLELLPRGARVFVLKAVVPHEYQLDETVEQNVVALVVALERLEHSLESHVVYSLDGQRLDDFFAGVFEQRHP